MAHKIKDELLAIDNKINTKEEQIEKLKQEKREKKQKYISSLGKKFIELAKIENPEVDYWELSDFLDGKINEAKQQARNIE